MDDLSDRQKGVLEDLIDVAARLSKLNVKSLTRMRDHVREFGTDHEGGLRVDTLVIALLEEARQVKRI